jgi:hypothetical protein
MSMRYAALHTVRQKIQITTAAQPSSSQLRVEIACLRTKGVNAAQAASTSSMRYGWIPPIRYVRAAAVAFTSAR